jgi:hypothetical protein
LVWTHPIRSPSSIRQTQITKKLGILNFPTLKK